MTWYRAEQNISVAGSFMAWHEERELAPSSEVDELVAAGLLVPRGEDGSYPTPTVTPHRCCGG